MTQPIVPPFDAFETWEKRKHRTRTVLDEIGIVIRIIKGLLYLVLWAATLPIEVFMHTRFGVRYLNLLSVIGGVVALQTAGELAGPEAAPWGVWSSVIFFFVAVGHAIHARLLESKGVQWHSRSPGEPFKIWRLIPGQRTPFDVERFLEPMAVFGIGMLINTVNPFGLSVMGMAVLLFVKKWLEYQQFRNDLLDQIDGQIEAEVMAELVDQKRTPWESKGFIVPKAAMRKARNSPSVADAMASMNSEAAQGDGSRADTGAVGIVGVFEQGPEPDGEIAAMVGGGPKRLE